MSTNASSDITDLCNVAGINTSNYLQFARTRGADNSPRPSEVTFVPNSDNISVTSVAHSDLRQIIHPVTNRKQSEVQQPAEPAPPVEREQAPINKPVEITARLTRIAVRKPMNRGERWLGLQAALDESTPSHNALHATNVMLFPSSGGVGVTTILASLGRVLSSNKDTVGIIENSSQSLIPMHFGARGSRTGCSTFHVTRGANAAPVHLLTPRSFGDSALTVLGTAASRSESEEWVTEGLDQIGSECDYLMIDTWQNMSFDLIARFAAKSVCLVPLLPDVRSTLRVRPILDVFQNLSHKTGSHLEPVFLLTKFDHNVSLHNDLRKWLGDQLKSRLSPIVIRRSDEFSEALAEGETIVDYAPNSGAAEDFYRLAEWLQGHAQSLDTPTFTRGMATGD